MPRSFTPEQDRLVANEYASGLSAYQIAEQWGVSRPAVLNAVRRAGGIVRTFAEANHDNFMRAVAKRRLFTDEEEQAIGEAYLAGETTVSLGEQHKVSPRTINGVLHRVGVVRRHSYRTCAVNDDAFRDAEQSEVASYFAGLLFADGSVVVKNGRAIGIALSLSGDDGVMVGKFREFVGSTHTMVTREQYTGYPNAKPVTRLSFTSEKIAADLARCGVVPGKTAIGAAASIMCNNRHWWRGCIDGDGWLGIRRDGIYMGFTGTKQACDQFLAFANSIRPSKVNVTRNHSIWKVVLSGEVAREVVRCLYSDCQIALPRKYKIANEIINTNKSDEPLTKDMVLSVLCSGPKTVKQVATALGMVYDYSSCHLQRVLADLAAEDLVFRTRLHGQPGIPWLYETTNE